MNLPRAVPVFSLLVAALFAPPRTVIAQRNVPDVPIIFVHGNGDHAGLWDTTIWRFESNGYDPSRLFAVDLPNPLATGSVNKAEENRSTPEDQTAALAAFVTRVLLRTGANKVALVGSSRGGMTIRNYIRFGGGAAHVSHVLTGGSPHHGVFALADVQPDNEFNGAGTYLTSLNAGEEVVRGVKFLTLRSDHNDKYAQPEMRGAGPTPMRTNVDATGPALRGAQDVVLPGTDHRETAFAPSSFRAQYEFITGRAPTRGDIASDSVAILDGMISANVNGGPTNLPLAGATVTVYEVDRVTGERIGAPAHLRTTTGDGRWGPFRAKPTSTYEFEVVPRDSAVVFDVFRSAFPRGSRYVNFRLPAPQPTRGDSVSVMIVRPRGYFGAGRDSVQFDGAAASGIPPGVPTVDRAIKWFSGAQSQRVVTRVNGETIVVRTRPGDRRRLVLAEFSYD